MTKLATGALALEDGSIFWGEGHGATGIAAGERENVFRPFYRLDHARNQDNGNTGLGLAITHDARDDQVGVVERGPERV